MISRTHQVDWDVFRERRVISPLIFFEFRQSINGLSMNIYRIIEAKSVAITPSIPLIAPKNCNIDIKNRLELSP